MNNLEKVNSPKGLFEETIVVQEAILLAFKKTILKSLCSIIELKGQDKTTKHSISGKFLNLVSFNLSSKFTLDQCVIFFIQKFKNLNNKVHELSETMQIWIANDYSEQIKFSFKSTPLCLLS